MKKPALIAAVIVSIFAVFSLAACTDESPDTSAPERVEIERSADWRGALLYIADAGGPVVGWGSIRVFDNVSGFVEKTVEQTFATTPSDMYVTPDGSTMYVSGMATGLVDKFLWDGNNWHRGTRDITSPSTKLYAMQVAPDGRIIVAGISPDSTTGALYALDTAADRIGDDPLTFPQIAEAHGVAWSTDGTTAYISGPASGGPLLLLAAWPPGTVTRAIPLPSTAVNQVELSPDGRVLYAACPGEILIIDPVSGTPTGSLKPSGDAGTEYYDVAFSGDGRFLFAPGTAPGGDSTLYVIDTADGTVVNQVAHVSIRANGIKRTE